MKHRWFYNKYYLLIALLLFKPVVLDAQNYANKTFKQLNTRSGLSSNTVNDIVQDSHGYIWIATDEGLNRFDGYKVLTFAPDSSGNSMFKHQHMLDLQVGLENVLWIGTKGGGLYKMYTDSLVAENYTMPELDNRMHGNARINNIFQSENGNLWIGTEGGLNRFDVDKNAFVDSWSSQEMFGEDNAVGINSIYEDYQGRIWIGTEGEGLHVYRISDHSLERFGKDMDGRDLSGLRVQSMVSDQKGNLWVATFGKGLLVFNSDQNGEKAIAHYDISNSDLTSNYLTTLMFDQNGVLWVGTYGGGLNALFPEAGDILVYRNRRENPTSLGDNIVWSLYQDATQNLWVGTHLGGVSRMDLKPEKFANYVTNFGETEIGQNNDIVSLAEGPDNHIWVGTVDGLNTLDRRRGFYTHFSSNSAQELEGPIWSIAVDNTGGLWISDKNKDLQYRPARQGSFKPFIAQKRATNAKLTNVNTVVSGREETVWVGTNKGLFQIETSTQSISEVDKQIDGINLSSSSINCIYQPSDSLLWVGTENGLVKLNTRTGALDKFMLAAKEDSESFVDDLLQNSINDMVHDAHGDLWVITLKDVFVLSRDEHQLKKIDLNGEITQNTILHNILPGSGNDLWISSNQGLFRLRLEDSSIKVRELRKYVQENYPNLQSNSFNYGAKLKTSSGELFFGGDYGLNSFYPDQVEDHQYTPQVVITEFRKLDEDLASTTTSYSIKPHMKFAHHENEFAIDFAALDFTNPDWNRYKYRMIGLNDEWIENQNRNYVIYTNLSPGEYEFQVIGTNSDGVWNQEPARLKISIVPPFWQTKAFLFSCIIAGVMMIYGGVKYREKKLKDANLLLEQKVNERTKELRKTEEIFRLISENAADLICMLDSDGNFVFVNPSVETMLGYDPEALKGENIKDYIYQDDFPDLYEKYQSILRNNGAFYNEFRVRHHNGEWRTLVSAGSLLQAATAEEKHILLIAHDITDRIETEKKLKRMRDEAIRANKAKSAFLAGISHELRTPLNAILGYSQVLYRDPQISNKQKNFVDTMYRSGKHLLSMINDVLDISKIEAGGVELYPQELDLKELLKDIESMFRLQSERKGLRFIYDAEASIPQYVEIDSSKLRQILINLIGNAIKFTEEGEVELRVRTASTYTDLIETASFKKIKQHLEKEDSEGTLTKPYGVFQISDTGKGIEDDDLDTIFKPFKQVDTTGFEGTGLGLAITKRLVTMMGGEIIVESALGEGSTFSFYLPLEVIEEPTSLMKNEKEDFKVTGIIGTASPRIMIVDDVRSNVELLEDLLIPVGFNCFVAENGKEAIKLFQECDPDLILMDLRMPVMNGKEATQYIRNELNRPDVPILAVTASGFKGTKDELLNNGFDEFMSKPLVYSELFNTLKEYLGLEYEYHSKPESIDSNGDKSLNVKKLAKDIDTLPEDIRKSIREAIELMNMDDIKVLASEAIGDEYVSQTLHHLVSESEYSKLLELNELLNPIDQQENGDSEAENGYSV